MDGSPFTFAEADIALPTGAYAGGRRYVLRFGKHPVVAVTVGPFRPYLHPVWTPAGVVVTAESPADHPHHCGLWCAADHVCALMPAPDGVERYDYNFYVDDVFQGRAPGRIRTLDIACTPLDERSARITQTLDWRGPREWAAPDGRRVLIETRTTTVQVAPHAHVLDVVSELAAQSAAVELGRTRHAFFNARVGEAISLSGARPVDDRGHVGGPAISGEGACWVDFTGPVGHGAEAGIAVVPAHGSGESWFVSDWGVMTTGSIRRRSVRIEPGGRARFACRFVIHDGRHDAADLVAPSLDF